MDRRDVLYSAWELVSSNEDSFSVMEANVVHGFMEEKIIKAFEKTQEENKI